MISKPSHEWRRESAVVGTLRGVATGGTAAVKAAGFYARGIVLWSVALLWGWAALAGGLFSGSLPTLIGVGSMAVAMAWWGTRLFKKARR